VSTKYEGLYEQLLRSLKFDLMRQAVEPISQIMIEVLNDIRLPENILICPLPTAPSRIRQRGFDHTKLIANKISSNLGIKNESLLKRRTNVRQLGSTRNQRMAQMTKEFYTKYPEKIEGRTILLIDDVMTTGASLSSASKVLKAAGAKRVYAIVFAQKV
jgi:ComF family protein